MRFSTVLPLALVASPLAVSAAGQLGYAIGFNKPDGSCKAQADYEADMDALSDTSGIVRTYSASSCNAAQAILAAAANKNFQVMIGVWPDTEDSLNADIAALTAANADGHPNLYAITVGSETLYRGTFDGPTLLSKIQQVGQTFPNTLIGTADSWNLYANGTADALITGGVKLLLVNAFAYWQDTDINNATKVYLDDLQQAFERIQSKSGSTDAIEIWNGETGWPTDGGSNYGSSIAGTANAQTFIDNGVCAVLSWGFNAFYFEAFDEPSKPASKGQDGTYADETHWGASTADRTSKVTFNC